MNKIESVFVSKVGVSFFNVFVLLIGLFFLWGFALGLLEVLNKHFQDIIASSTLKYTLVLLAYYAGYFLMPIPASLVVERFGFKNGVLLGLFCYAFGAFMFIPVTHLQSFPLFVFALFCIALGMAALETSVNLYTALVGEKKFSTFRLTFAQAFTSVGIFFGPLVGSGILADIQSQSQNEFSMLEVPYVGVGVLVFFVAILLLLSKLPLITSQEYQKPKEIPNNSFGSKKSYLKLPHFIGAMITMAFYVLAQASLFGFYTDYIIDLFKGMEQHTAIGHAYLLKLIQFIGGSTILNDHLYHTVAGVVFIFAGLGLFALGRFVGSFLLIKVLPNRLLLINALVSFLLTIIIALNLGLISFIALCLLTFFMSVMFPVIFSLGIRKMKYMTNRASALIIMAITGGSFYSIMLNLMPNTGSSTIGIGLLLLSFLVIIVYGVRGYKVHHKY